MEPKRSLRADKSLFLVSILRQINPVHILPPCFIKIPFHIILSSNVDFISKIYRLSKFFSDFSEHCCPDVYCEHVFAQVFQSDEASGKHTRPSFT
jgi:hypothetical protein